MSTDPSATRQRSTGVADTLRAGGPSDPPPAAPSRAPELAAGVVLDGVYRVIERIGGGAMGTVYLVEHQGLGRRFAAKVVAAAYNTDPEVLARFRNEARVASSIQHENIVDVTHLGRTPDGSLFVVMELLEGCDLRHRLLEAETNTAHPWLPDEESRRIVRDVLAGLHAAHEAGIVHRDLKPDNIFLSRKGGVVRAKIVDFGISKGAASGAEDVRLTRTGQIIGTPLYMSPEQSRGTGEVDRRSDVYAMGVILYEMATGRLPFEATSIYDLIVKHATERPPPARTRRADLPEAVDAVIQRCLEKQPAARYQTAREVLDALEAAWASTNAEPPLALPRATATTESVSVPPEVTTTRRGPITALAAVGVLALVVVVLLLGRGASPAPPPRAMPDAPAPPPSMLAVTTPTAEPSVPSGTEPPADAHRTITSDPPGATVESLGARLGTTPLDLTLRAGAPTEITLSAVGRRTVTRTITTRDPDTIAITLERTATRTRTQEPDLPALAPH